MFAVLGVALVFVVTGIIVVIVIILISICILKRRHKLIRHVHDQEAVEST